MARAPYTNCIFFDGYKPCKNHKLHGCICEECREYSPENFRVLILKIGAAGEVIRITPILHKLKASYPGADITWLTDFSDFIPESLVNRVLHYDWKNVHMLLEEEFDLLLSLDKEHHVCAFANKIKATQKKGFLLNKTGKIIPADKDAEEKWLTGIFDDLMKENKKHYVEEIFEICGWKWAGEKYIIEGYVIPEINFQRDKDTPLLGLNTGAGKIWPTRIWPEKSWALLISKLIKQNYRVLLLGGPDEHEKNIRLAKETGAYYEGIKSYKEFIGLVYLCDLVVTTVTMALHIAIGLAKKVVLLNNIFNRNEFYLYDLGSILEPDLPCKACYKRTFDSKCIVPNCMDLISPDAVIAEIKSLLSN